MLKHIRSKSLIASFRCIELAAGKNYALNFVAQKDATALKYILRKRGAKIGTNVSLCIPLVFQETRDLTKLEIGDDVHIGKECFFDLSERIQIGKRVTISMRCMFITHIDVGASKLKEIYPRKAQPIVIRDDSYLSCCVTVLPGVAVNSAALVAAQSLVTNDVPEHTLVGGVPAKMIKELQLPLVTGKNGFEVAPHSKVRRSQI